mmetsp:Transcript_62224/g.110943  ORF Transcript_62224/g.110943 Transcript_62224/m.110943 type:complete len:81 (+) Transcript_62224:990-1232(+)
MNGWMHLVMHATLWASGREGGGEGSPNPIHSNRATRDASSGARLGGHCKEVLHLCSAFSEQMQRWVYAMLGQAPPTMPNT